MGILLKKNEINVINYGRLKLKRLVCENKVILIKGEMGIFLKIKKLCKKGIKIRNIIKIEIYKCIGLWWYGFY